jgi:hypothetical protein
VGRGQFTFYRSYYEAIKQLPKKEQANVLLAICAYALDEETTKLTGTAAAIFMLVKPTLDASKRKAESGKAGGSAKQTGSKRQAKPKQTAREEEIEKEVEVEDEIEIENENECYGGGGSCAGVPTFEKVCAYAELMDAGRPFDPHFLYAGDLAGEFWRHYERDGWQIEGKPIRNWQALFKTWCDNARDKHRWEVSG